MSTHDIISLVSYGLILRKYMYYQFIIMEDTTSGNNLDKMGHNFHPGTSGMQKQKILYNKNVVNYE